MEPSNRPDRSLLVSGALWFGAFVAARFLLQRGDLAMPLSLFVALLPVPAFAWFLWSLSAGIRRLDELERRIQLEALGLAFPLAMLLLMGLGLVELAVPLSRDDWSYRHVWAMLPILYFIGLAVARRRYQ